MMTSVAIYTRLSSDTPGRQQTATKRQEQACRALANLREWDVAQVYEDVDLSAYKKGVKRPAYESLLEAIEARRVSGVMVWKLDRLVRRSAEFERFWALCEEAGAILVSATEPIDTSTDLGVALVRILVSFAGLESATMGLRIRAKKAEQARAGIPSGKIGFGFTGRRHVRVVAREATLIREGAQRVLEGTSAYAIAEDWNRRGIASPEGALWQTNSVKKLLLADRIVGDSVYQGKVVARDCWPAILDRETQTRLRIILRAPSDTRPGRQLRLLTGLIHCGSCSGPLRGNKRGGTPTYRCSPPPLGCSHTQIDAAVLDAYLFDASCHHLEDLARFGYAPAPTTSDRERSNRDVEEQRIRLRDLADDYYIHHLISTEQYRDYRSHLLEQIEQVVSADRAADSSTLPSVETLRERWPTMTRSQRREKIDLLVSRIVLESGLGGAFHPDRVHIRWHRDLSQSTPTAGYVTCDRAARILGVDRDTVSQWIRARKLPARKIGRVYFMNEEDIESYATSHSYQSRTNAARPSNHGSRG
jgi:site-specific DNA recombinase